ncbi:GroES-like protein [Aspergillus heteromorphus CBS 117.55]|uniref:alcohol dehydrogenase (NADP(+)) n=1 Tax=Aspergillus heteromorphus CBS 117.55 TaxID=1448321 RepID=A0A317VYY1_9EURO|nr:GroES-like protein [Aspergillus heteromorphus CBS 117.55]PWY77100.1 GroES-like protein [Aspergillus heteromorphus CBS 117.55]
MTTPDTFHGWVSHSPTTPLTLTTFTPKPFTETDIEIRITHCGICGTDVHTLRSGWGPTDYPCVVGHEIIGIVTRVGREASFPPNSPSALQIGDRVGIGAQCHSCFEPTCDACTSNQESYCPQIVSTYNSRWYLRETKRRGGEKTYGGFARTWRGPADFVFKIPDALPSAQAAPLLCAGVTMFTPLRKYGAGKGRAVGIVGIGGLGHLGVMFAKALGCESVVGISRTGGKEAEVRALGADGFIATAETGWERKWSRSLDLIICTVDGDDMPLEGYLKLLKMDGTFVQVGAPEKPLPRLMAWALIQKGVKVTGSNIGSREDISEMLRVAAEKQVLPWVESRPMEEVNATLKDMEAGKARFRYVLENAEKESRL